MQFRTLIQGAILAAMAVAPALAFAQTSTSAPKTRAEVKAELRQLESVGFKPAQSDDGNYPAGIQAAEARIQQQGMAQTPTTDTTGYGAAPAPAMQSGQPAR